MSPGSSIAHYRILSKLGEGGMGAVYRATDTKLNRDVAIKILPGAFAQDSDRLARFTREAHVLASLNHPNIAVIYGVEERALVMELVDGPTLAGRIAAGPMALEDALPIAKQIAEALEYAHERGIVHRDLKPANIKVTPEGRVKVLDFGLAKAMSNDGAADADPVSSPTITMRATQAGVLLGTAAYMSPEQARGQGVDRRADIWAFGVVLCEMLTGRPLFAAPTLCDTLAAVLKTEPEITAVPAGLRPIVERCLRKDPRSRWRDIGDVRVALEEGVWPAAASPAPARSSRPAWMIVAAAFAILAFLAFGLLWYRPPSDQRVTHFQIAAPPGADFQLGSGGSAISPDGRTIAFVASTGGVPRIWVRPLNAVTAREIAGTEGGRFPFWSPDSRSLGFFAAGKMKRVDLSGGPPVVLADAPVPLGASWSEQGTILFVPIYFGGLQRIPASGGAAAQVSAPDRAAHETGRLWPHFLPGGRRFLYYSVHAQPTDNGVYIGSLDRPGENTRLVGTSSSAVYVPPHGRRSGYLLWVRGQTMVARAFDPESGRFSGEILPVPGAEAVPTGSGSFYPGFSASADGAILFGGGTEQYRLTWFSRDGKPIVTLGPPDHFPSLRISPDATRVAVEAIGPAGRRDIATIDIARGVESRLPSRSGVLPVWSPDSRWIYYNALNGTSLFERNASGAGQEQTVLDSQHIVVGDDVSPDGRFLLYEENDGNFNFWLLPRDASGPGGRKPVPYLKTSSNQTNGRFSPDGKWIAYTSDESGHPQVYVQSYPASEDAKWQVSADGGNFAMWRRDGKELFYLAPDGKLRASSVRAAGKVLEFGAPATLFRILVPFGVHTYTYDVAPDGQRILTMTPATANSSSGLTVILNWQGGVNH